MAAHLRAIHAPVCTRCVRKATHTLYNTRNAPIADYCQQHSGPALKEFLASERKEFEDASKG